jgi:phospholipid/cholesterol/gamma-HCH transport system permease protein
MRCAIPYGSEVAALRANGRFAAWREQGVDPMRQEVLPRVVAGVFAVWLCTALSAVLSLVVSYLVVYGFTPYGWAPYTRTVGQVFGPAVTLVFVVKTLLFSLAVAVVPMAAATQDNPANSISAEIQGLVRMFTLLLLFEALSLLGNYY